jgi:hypothetical protein
MMLQFNFKSCTYDAQHSNSDMMMPQAYQMAQVAADGH